MANKKDFDFNKDAPLARAKGEHIKAHRALIDYANMGAGRSYAKLIDRYQSDSNPPTKRHRTMGEWAIRYKWQERISIYSDMQTARELELFEEERKEWRKKRRKMLDRYINTVSQALITVDVTESNLRDVTTAVKTVVGELRTEFNDNPSLTIAGDSDNPIHIKRAANFTDMTDDELERHLMSSIKSLGLQIPDDIDDGSQG